VPIGGGSIPVLNAARQLARPQANLEAPAGPVAAFTAAVGTGWVGGRIAGIHGAGWSP